MHYLLMECRTLKYQLLPTGPEMSPITLSRYMGLLARHTVRCAICPQIRIKTEHVGWGCPLLIYRKAVYFGTQGGKLILVLARSVRIYAESRGISSAPL